MYLPWSLLSHTTVCVHPLSQTHMLTVEMLVKLVVHDGGDVGILLLLRQVVVGERVCLLDPSIPVCARARACVRACMCVCVYVYEFMCVSVCAYASAFLLTPGHHIVQCSTPDTRAHTPRERCVWCSTRERRERAARGEQRERGKEGYRWTRRTWSEMRLSCDSSTWSSRMNNKSKRERSESGSPMFSVAFFWRL